MIVSPDGPIDDDGFEGDCPECGEITAHELAAKYGGDD